MNVPLCFPDEMGKPGSDAGMPGIEDSEVGKIEELQFGAYHFSPQYLSWSGPVV
jgi:hypothetical protein